MFRTGKRNKQNNSRTNVIKPFVSPTKEADERAELLIEIELEERKLKGIINAVASNSKKLSVQDGSCEIIQKEHIENLEKLQNEHAILFNNVEDKKEEYRSLNGSISNSQKVKIKLDEIIPKFEKSKKQLEKDIDVLKENHATTKGNCEAELTVIRQKTEDSKVIYNDVIKQMKVEKKELVDLIEKNNMENKVLAQRQKDLQIYAARLHKKYPNEKIII